MLVFFVFFYFIVVRLKTEDKGEYYSLYIPAQVPSHRLFIFNPPTHTHTHSMVEAGHYAVASLPFPAEHK